MATNTLLQRLDPAADTTGSSVAASHRRQVEDFLAGGAITAGAWVSLDYSKTGADRALYVRVEDTSGGAVAIGVPVVGVALEAAASGDRVRVVVAGYVENAQVATGSTENLALALDTTNSGRATIADAANVNICGVALEDATDNKADCWVFAQF